MNRYYIRFYDKETQRVSYFNGEISSGTVIPARTHDRNLATRLSADQCVRVQDFYRQLESDQLEMDCESA